MFTGKTQKGAYIALCFDSRFFGYSSVYFNLSMHNKTTLYNRALPCILPLLARSLWKCRFVLCLVFPFYRVLLPQGSCLAHSVKLKKTAANLIFWPHFRRSLRFVSGIVKPLRVGCPVPFELLATHVPVGPCRVTTGA